MWQILHSRPELEFSPGKTPFTCTAALLWGFKVWVYFMLRCIGAVCNASSRVSVLSGIAFLSLSNISLISIWRSVFDLFSFHFLPFYLENFPFVLVWILSFFLFLPFIAYFVVSIFVKFSSLDPLCIHFTSNCFATFSEL